MSDACEGPPRCVAPEEEETVRVVSGTSSVTAVPFRIFGEVDKRRRTEGHYHDDLHFRHRVHAVSPAVIKLGASSTIAWYCISSRLGFACIAWNRFRGLNKATEFQLQWRKGRGWVRVRTWTYSMKWILYCGDILVIAVEWYFSAFYFSLLSLDSRLETQQATGNHRLVTLLTNISISNVLQLASNRTSH